MQTIFLSGLSHCDQGLIVVIVNYLQIWDKKERIIVSSWVISSRMGTIYIETPYIFLYRPLVLGLDNWGLVFLFAQCTYGV